MPVGILLPFSVPTGSLGFIDVTYTELQATASNVLSLLITNWGERVGHFRMGCNMIEFLFEPLRGDILRQRISDRITEQCQTWLPFVRLDTIDVVFHSEDPSVGENQFRVDMSFGLVGRPGELTSLSRTFG